MESLTTGTLTGTGSFRCEECGYVVTLAATDSLPDCPGCGGSRFARASLFSGGRFQRRPGDEPSVEEREALVARARTMIGEPGQYLAWDDGVRVLDDRSLNGVFVNGERVEWRVLSDGDEIVVGRYRLHFLEAVEQETAGDEEPVEAAG